MDYGVIILARSDGLKLKCISDLFIYHRYTAFCFIRHHLIDWSDVDYLWIIVMLLSSVWTVSDGTHALQRGRGYVGEQGMYC